MGFILGFGKCEEDVRNKVMDIVNKSSGTWNELQQIAKDWNAPNEAYDKMSKETSPERYTNIYIYSDKVKFNHINRRHALSPDGWALWQVDVPINHIR